MLRRLAVLIVCVAVVAALAAPAWALSTGFEEGVGHDGELIGSYYSGITFTAGGSGQSWVFGDGSTGNWNVSSWPTGDVLGGSGEYWIHDKVFAWAGTAGGDGRIDFDRGDGTFLQLGYSCISNLYLEAYDSTGTLIASTSGGPNLRWVNGNASGPGTLRVDAPTGKTISYAIIHDTGNYWLVDDLVTNDSGAGGSSVPEPCTLALLGLGGVGVVPIWRRRRR